MLPMMLQSFKFDLCLILNRLKYEDYFSVKTQFVERIYKSVYRTDINGLEEQEKMIEIALEILHRTVHKNHASNIQDEILCEFHNIFSRTRDQGDQSI
tara:strand:+ start:302 stop:595 length:294 start_codon:yes stop_codon:yes gene_type:complete